MQKYTWRAIEEDPSGRRKMEALKELGVDQWQEHHLFQRLDVVAQPPHLVKADRRIHLRDKATASMLLQKCIALLKDHQLTVMASEMLTCMSTPCKSASQAISEAQMLQYLCIDC